MDVPCSNYLHVEPGIPCFNYLHVGPDIPWSNYLHIRPGQSCSNYLHVGLGIPCSNYLLVGPGGDRRDGQRHPEVPHLRLVQGQDRADASRSFCRNSGGVRK